MPTEFLTPEQIKQEYGWVDRPVLAPEGHPHRALLPGQMTDDTGQALAIAHAYLPNGQLTAAAVARELLEWADSTGEILPLVLGPSTRHALEQLRSGGDPRQTGRKGATNGASYRAVIVGLVNFNRLDRLIEQVVEACLPTHGTCVAISGGAAVAAAISKALIEDSTLEGIFLGAKQGAATGRKHGEWMWGTPLEGRIDLALQIVSQAPQPETALADLYRYVGVDLLVAESVATAFGLVALAKGDPMQAIFYGANIGGDTDTIAAISGAICGAWQGIAAIDQQMLAEVEKVNHLDLKAEAAHLVNIIKSQE
ncbi:MAG: ADP-ribosylglycohydrolase family protein [Chloroflexi bacterium]|nr:ADP-ribosylglycohydrolase family protein [Chloroflexota bacterium]